MLRPNIGQGVYLPEVVFPPQGTPLGCYHGRHGAEFIQAHLCTGFGYSRTRKVKKSRKIGWKSTSDSRLMTAERGVALTIESRAGSGCASRGWRRPITEQHKQASSEILQTTYKPGECRVLIPNFPSLITRPPRVHQVHFASPNPS